jgi:hypothetical protein
MRLPTIISVVYACNCTVYLTGWGGGGLLTPTYTREKGRGARWSIQVESLASFAVVGVKGAMG